MRRVLILLALIPLTSCATMFNGTQQDIKINFYNAETGAPISNDKVTVQNGNTILNLNSDQTYTLPRKSFEDLHYLTNGYLSKTDKVQATISVLYYLNLLWEIPFMIGTGVCGAALAGQLGWIIGVFSGAAIGTVVAIGVDLGVGGAYVYPDEIKVFLDKK
jgi:hypothetical protein